MWFFFLLFKFPEINVFFFETNLSIIPGYFIHLKRNIQYEISITTQIELFTCNCEALDSVVIIVRPVNKGYWFDPHLRSLDIMGCVLRQSTFLLIPARIDICLC